MIDNTLNDGKTIAEAENVMNPVDSQWRLREKGRCRRLWLFRFIALGAALAGVLCITVSHGLYVGHMGASGDANPSVVVNSLDAAGGILLLVAMVAFVVSPLIARKTERRASAEIDAKGTA